MLIVIFLGLFGIWMAILAMMNSWTISRRSKLSSISETKNADYLTSKAFNRQVSLFQEPVNRKDLRQVKARKSELLEAFHDLWHEILHGV